MSLSQPASVTSAEGHAANRFDFAEIAPVSSIDDKTRAGPVLVHRYAPLLVFGEDVDGGGGDVLDGAGGEERYGWCEPVLQVLVLQVLPGDPALLLKVFFEHPGQFPFREAGVGAALVSEFPLKTGGPVAKIISQLVLPGGLPLCLLVGANAADQSMAVGGSDEEPATWFQNA